jgi:biopolymer transport protein ExbD
MTLLQIVGICILLIFGCKTNKIDLPKALNNTTSIKVSKYTYNAVLDYGGGEVKFQDSILTNIHSIKARVSEIADVEYEHFNLILKIPSNTPYSQVLDILKQFRVDKIYHIYLMVNSVCDSVAIPISLISLFPDKEIKHYICKYNISSNEECIFINDQLLTENNLDSLANIIGIEEKGKIIIELNKNISIQNLVSMVDFYWYSMHVYQKYLARTVFGKEYKMLNIEEQLIIDKSRSHKYRMKLIN